MHYVKHFDILGVDTAQIPCIELHGVPNTATEGAVGLLGVNVDSYGKEVYICTAVNGAVYTWKALKDGKDGVSVIGTYINTNGELIITLSNGQTLNAGMVKGTTGDPGKEGASVVKVETNDNYELLVTLSNGVTLNAGSVVPERYEEFMSDVSANYVRKSTLPITVSNQYFDSTRSSISLQLDDRTAGDLIGLSTNSIHIVSVDSATFDTTTYPISTYLKFDAASAVAIHGSSISSDFYIALCNEHAWGYVTVRISTINDTQQCQIMSGVIHLMNDSGEIVGKCVPTRFWSGQVYCYVK